MIKILYFVVEPLVAKFSRPKYCFVLLSLSGSKSWLHVADFLRWHSPPDWLENDTNIEVNKTSARVDLLSVRGQLSMRMQKEGNHYTGLCFQQLIVMKLNLNSNLRQFNLDMMSGSL